jgi:protocatechuate 3,4-dioxygenase beta subunit
MPFAARRRHQHWTSDFRYIDHELGGRAYVVSVMDNHSRYILSSALTRRPPHIHVRVRAPGYEELITQRYPERGQRKANFDLVLVAE